MLTQVAKRWLLLSRPTPRGVKGRFPITRNTGRHSRDPMVASFCRRSHFDLRKERLHVSVLLCLKIGRSPRRALRSVRSQNDLATIVALSLAKLEQTLFSLSTNRRLDAAGLS
jgi:hypothetical protein